MKRYLWNIFLCFLCLISPLLLSSVAFAVIPQPDSSPSIFNTHAARNLLVDDDVLIYGQYYLPYATPPDTLASDSFIFRLINTDNVSEIGAIVPYSYFDSGYNYGVFAFYLDDTVALTWAQPYIIRISENPAQFATPVSYDFVMGTGSTIWFNSTDQEDNQAELTTQILAIAQAMETYYPTYTLVEASASGSVLSSPTGESYFRAAIPNIQSMTPALFLVQIVVDDYTSTNWTTTEFDSYEARFDTTYVGASENATATQFGITPGMVMGIIAILPLCIGAIIVANKKFRRSEAGFLASVCFLLMGATMGWVPAPLFATILQCMGFYIAYLWFYARA